MQAGTINLLLPILCLSGVPGTSDTRLQEDAITDWNVEEICRGVIDRTTVDEKDCNIAITASGVDEVGGAGVLDGGIGVELLRAIVDESAAGELVGGGAVINTCSVIFISNSYLIDSPNCTATRGTSLDAGVPNELISLMNN